MYNKDIIIQMKREGKTWKEIGEYLETDGENIRWYARSTGKKEGWYQLISGNNPHDESDERDKKVYSNDGSISSEIRTQLEYKRVFKPPDLLEIHGFDSDEFKLKQVISNEWSTTNAKGEKYYNFQSKIIAIPIHKEITPEDIAKIFENVKPRKIDLSTNEITNEYLFVGLSDMHIQPHEQTKYDKLQKDIADLILESYAEILITLHGDFFHVDNFVNTTERGTRVDDTDLVGSVEYGYQFLIPLIELALECSPCVKLVYLCGNHSPSVDYMFIQGIKRLYPDLIVDDEVDDFKHSWLGNHSLFLHHGDKVKNPKRLHEIMTSKFAKEWGSSQSRYLITGHLHHEKSLSFGGLTHYQLQSPSELTKYDKREGYVDCEDGLMVFRFDDVKRRQINYLGGD